MWNVVGRNSNVASSQQKAQLPENEGATRVTGSPGDQLCTWPGFRFSPGTERRLRNPSLLCVTGRGLQSAERPELASTSCTLEVRIKQRASYLKC